jgi:hypothetical protein
MKTNTIKQLLPLLTVALCTACSRLPDRRLLSGRNRTGALQTASYRTPEVSRPNGGNRETGKGAPKFNRRVVEPSMRL